MATAVACTCTNAFQVTLLFFSNYHRYGKSRKLSFGRIHLRNTTYQMKITLQWRHNGCDGVSTHQHHDCLLHRLFRRRSKKTSKLCVTGLRAGNSPIAGEFPAQKASNAENVFIWWRHYDQRVLFKFNTLRAETGIPWPEYFRHSCFYSVWPLSFSYHNGKRTTMVERNKQALYIGIEWLWFQWDPVTIPSSHLNQQVR